MSHRFNCLKQKSWVFFFFCPWCFWDTLSLFHISLDWMQHIWYQFQHFLGVILLRNRFTSCVSLNKLQVTGNKYVENPNLYAYYFQMIVTSLDSCSFDSFLACLKVITILQPHSVWDKLEQKCCLITLAALGHRKKTLVLLDPVGIVCSCACKYNQI